MIADTRAASDQSAAAERAVSIKALRGELRGKEFELDGLIKSLIDFPPKTGEAGTRADPKRSLKLRGRQLAEVVDTFAVPPNPAQAPPPHPTQTQQKA